MAMGFVMGGTIIFITHMGHFYSMILAFIAMYGMYFEIMGKLITVLNFLIGIHENEELLVKSHMQYIKWATILIA